MPRSRKDSKPAFQQIGKLDMQTEIYGICILALKNNCPKYAKRVIHFIYTRVLTPEAILEGIQHTYNMDTHKVVANDTEIQLVAINDGLNRLYDAKDHQVNNFLENERTAYGKELSEVGSYALCQACERARKLASALKTFTQKPKKDNETRSVATEVTKNKNSCQIGSHHDVQRDKRKSKNGDGLSDKIQVLCKQCHVKC
eukprot:6752502-Ditylum_brightwellii.AAC.1